MPPTSTNSTDIPEPTMPQPPDAPSLLAASLDDARHVRREQTTILRDILAEAKAHSEGAKARHVEAMAASAAIRSAVADIDADIDARDGADAAWRARLGKGAAAVWATAKGPLTQLLLAVGAYLTWRYLTIPLPPTPAEVAPVVVAAPPSAGPLPMPILEDATPSPEPLPEDDGAAAGEDQ